MHLMLITNKADHAVRADRAGVDSVIVDLERIGKADRQAGRSTVVSEHTIEDVRSVRQVLSRAELIVRLDPSVPDFSGHVLEVLDEHPNAVMLPMFRTKGEVERLCELVDGRSKIVLLAETGAALARLDHILTVGKIDAVHVGLNDLHLELGLDFMFEIVAGGLLIAAAASCEQAGVRFGFGGVGVIGDSSAVAAEAVVGEHARIGSSSVILGRAYWPLLEVQGSAFELAVDAVRDHFFTAMKFSDLEKVKRHHEFQRAVWQVAQTMTGNRSSGMFT